MLTVFDVETSRFPDGNPYRASSECISYAVRQGEETVFGYHTDADFRGYLRRALHESSLLVVINGKFDIGWARRLGAVLPVSCRVWDCQLAEYYLSGQQSSFASMEQLCKLYGIEQKEGDVADYWSRGIETHEIPREVLQQYNEGDINRTHLIYQAQLVDQRMTPAIYKLVMLGGADLLVLQRMEENGIKYDKRESLARASECNEELVQVGRQLHSHLPQPAPANFNWDSGDSLSAFLYGGTIDEEIWNETHTTYKSGAKKGQEYVRRSFAGTRSYSFPGIFKPLPRTAVQKSTDARPIYSTAEPVLLQLKGGGRVGKEVVRLLLRRAELEKLANTYYSKIPALMEEMEWGNYVHGSYNQVVARTSRLSSSKPNMQNNPEVVDRMFVSRFD